MEDDARGNPPEAENEREADSSYWEGVHRTRRRLTTVRGEEARRDSGLGRAITRVGAMLANPWFFGGTLLLHLLWIFLNAGVLPGIRPWDPYPFTFLATIASVEAPILALLILMRQLRDAHVAELREETNLQVSLHAERQTSMLLRLMDDLHRTVVGEESEEIDEEDRERVERMREPLDPDRVLSVLEREVADGEAESDSETE